MIQVTSHMRILVCVQPADFRKGIDGLCQVCRQELERDPFSGCVFVFRNRRSTSVKILVYDGQGFWLCQKRMSKGSFRWWPRSAVDKGKLLEACQLPVLLSGGDPDQVKAAPTWRRVGAK